MPFVIFRAISRKTLQRPSGPISEYALLHTVYWAIQAGLLTPLTFARHRLSPLAAFTSGAYFLHNGSEFANFTLTTLKAFFEARSHNVSGNKQ